MTTTEASTVYQWLIPRGPSTVLVITAAKVISYDMKIRTSVSGHRGEDSEFWYLGFSVEFHRNTHGIQLLKFFKNELAKSKPLTLV